MRYALLAATLMGLTATVAVAQTAPGVDPATGERPGHVAGSGESLPRSTTASNLPGTLPRSDIAPTLPASPLGDSGESMDYLRAARVALMSGKTGTAQESLEMAETRALDSSVQASQAGAPSQNRLVLSIHDALQALGTGDKALTLQLIDTALKS